MKYKTPEQLNIDTPDWFREWHDKTFWHFKYEVERSLTNHSRVLWAVFAAVIAIGIARIFIG